jgi:hypothetical protein
VGDDGLISVTGTSPAPGIDVGVGSAARGGWCWSGCHPSRRRRMRRVPRCSNHGTHKHRAASISSSRRGRCAFGRTGWGGGNIASALAGCLLFVLEPEKAVYDSEIVNTVLSGIYSNQIWTLWTDMPRSFASYSRSSVDGDAVWL